MNNFFNTQILKFGVVGIIGMIVDFSITWICKEKLKLNKYLSNSLGFCFALINNFILNKYWTYQQANQNINNQFLKFALVSLIGLAINNLILYGLNKYVKANFYFLKLITIGIVFFWNYFMNTFFTFY
jgi:putative flippase GtrA